MIAHNEISSRYQPNLLKMLKNGQKSSPDGIKLMTTKFN